MAVASVDERQNSGMTESRFEKGSNSTASYCYRTL